MLLTRSFSLAQNIQSNEINVSADYIFCDVAAAGFLVEIDGRSERVEMVVDKALVFNRTFRRVRLIQTATVGNLAVTLTFGSNGDRVVKSPSIVTLGSSVDAVIVRPTRNWSALTVPQHAVNTPGVLTSSTTLATVAIVKNPDSNTGNIRLGPSSSADFSEWLVPGQEFVISSDGQSESNLAAWYYQTDTASQKPKVIYK